MAETGAFDRLNEALFAQLDKLQSVDPTDREQMELAVEQTRAVSQLAGNIIANASTAIRAMDSMREAGMDAARLVGGAPRLLGGGR